MKEDGFPRLLRALTNAELEVLWIDHLRRKLDAQDFGLAGREARIAKISDRLRHQASHTLGHLIRREQLTWQAVLVDLAGKLEIKQDLNGNEIGINSTAGAVEKAILQDHERHLKEKREQLPQREREALRANIEDSISFDARQVARRIGLIQAKQSAKDLVLLPAAGGAGAAVARIAAVALDAVVLPLTVTVAAVGAVNATILSPNYHQVYMTVLMALIYREVNRRSPNLDRTPRKTHVHPC